MSDDDEKERRPTRKEGLASIHPPGVPSGPVVRMGSPVRTPPSMRGSASQATPSISVLEAAATPSLLSIATAPLSQRGSLLFVCNDCWRTFTDGSLSVCSCERPRPTGGWAAMPYLFRGRYLFVELLGRGGMGAVFRAYDQAAHDTPWVAVKVVQQSRPEIADLLKEMFQKEVAAAQMLAQHRQFFVQVLGHDGVDPAYLVLEHVPWQTLEEMLTSLPGDNEWLPPVQVARIGIAVLRGVAKMHFHRIVHRDLTPANIFIQRAAEGEGYDVKITDLGIWAFDQVQGDSESLTLVGRRPTIEGTPAYMSPEQSIGEPVGAASDLHTIGSLLWELATGVVPFPASHADLPPHELVEHRVALLKVPPKRPAGMPDGLYRVLLKALAFEQTKRWTSASEMRKALEAFVNQYHQQRQRDFDASFKVIEKLSEQVSSLKEKLVPMRGLIERLMNLGMVLREVREHREEAEPEALRAIADSTSKQLNDIRGELIALASWLEFVGGQTERRTVVRPPNEPEPQAAFASFASDRQQAPSKAPFTPIAVAVLVGLLLLIVYLLVARPNQGAGPGPAASQTEAAPTSQTQAPIATEPSPAAPVVTPIGSSSPGGGSSATPSKTARPSSGAGATPKTSAPAPGDGQRDLINKNPYE